ncbi:hypothetical protein RJ641_025181 [Dillenia turbinata]|uniref:Uncharacterized protein n=1 Tax=Dillenia turbinata TaxID=194707 RepID=A0AAN8W113_9MAGN
MSGSDMNLLDEGIDLLKNAIVMASETFVQPAIPRFDDHYDYWSMNFLRSKEYWHVVESRVADPVAELYK